MEKLTDPTTTPQSSPIRISKSLLISIIIVVIIACGFFLYGSGNQYKGLIKIKTTSSNP